MKIVKILNNSLVLAKTDDNKEIILMGKGIGYNKAIGYTLQQKDIEKVFVLKNNKISQDIMELAQDIDAVYFDLTKSIIDYAIVEHNMKLMDHIYLSLTDHISFAVKRFKEGITLDNFYTQEIKVFNPKEYDVGEYAIKLLNSSMDVNFPIDEVANIAFHFINAQQEHQNQQDNANIKKIVQDILNIVKYHFTIIYDEQSLTYQRFVTHLQFLARRVLDSNRETSMDNHLLNHILTTYSDSYECANKIEKYIFNNYDVVLSKDEVAYLVVHIENLRKKTKNKEMEKINET